MVQTRTANEKASWISYTATCRAPLSPVLLRSRTKGWIAAGETKCPKGSNCQSTGGWKA